jgi:hypothetical protein
MYIMDKYDMKQTGHAMTEETENDWQDRTFIKKAVPVFRVHAGEYVGSAASQTKLLGQVFDKAGFLIPKVGPVVGKAVGVLCEHAGNGLEWAANKIRGGYEIQGLPHAMQYLPSMWRKVGEGSQWLANLITPENIGKGLETYGTVSGALRTIKPDLRLPVFAPAAA